MQSSIFDMPSREKEDEEQDNKNKKKFRMSNILRRQNKQSDSPMVIKTNEMITQVHSLQEYKTHVADVTDALVVVFFTAPWCRTCLRLKPKMKAMAAGLHSMQNVKVVQIPLLDKESAALFEGLGVKSFPFVHLYHPEEGLVEELKLNRKLWNDFQKTLKEYLQGSCNVQYNENENDEDSITAVRQEAAMSALAP